MQGGEPQITLILRTAAQILIFIQRTYLMIQMYLKLAHGLLISYLIWQIVNDDISSPMLAVAEILLTVGRTILERKVIDRYARFQILASMVLGYIMFPNKARFISWIFLIKGLQVHYVFKAFRAEYFADKNLHNALFLYDGLRFTVCEYIFLGAVMLVYKMVADSVEEPIPETHVVMYQLAVTGSTIGYGDITPKSKFQMIFFTYAIPVICGSFVIYINSLVEIYTSTYLSTESLIPEEKPLIETPNENAG